MGSESGFESDSVNVNKPLVTYLTRLCRSNAKFRLNEYFCCLSKNMFNNNNVVKYDERWYNMAKNVRWILITFWKTSSFPCEIFQSLINAKLIMTYVE